MTLSRNDLWSLEQYSEKRTDFRKQVIAHKKYRQVLLSEHARVLFEDELTVRYQVQEMLRIEKVFEAAGIQEELDAYNPLIPDGTNWKATLMLEYDDIAERKGALEALIGVEDKVWMQVGDNDKVYAIADEDLERQNDVKTSSVHFLRFELSNEMIQAVKDNATIIAGCDHPALNVDGITLQQEVAISLAKDLAA